MGIDGYEVWAWMGEGRDARAGRWIAGRWAGGGRDVSEVRVWTGFVGGGKLEVGRESGW